MDFLVAVRLVFLVVLLAGLIQLHVLLMSVLLTLNRLHFLLDRQLAALVQNLCLLRCGYDHAAVRVNLR